MRLSDILSEIWISLMRKKLRSILTMIGIIIGTFALAIIWSLGSGLQIFLRSQLQFLSSPNIVECFPPGGINLGKLRSNIFGNIGKPRKIEGEGTEGFGNINLVYFSQKHLQTLRQIPHVKKVSPAIVVPGKWIRLKNKKIRVEINLSPWRKEIKRPIKWGREISSSSEIILPSAYAKVFNVKPKDLLGKTVEIKVGKHPFLQRYLQMNILRRSWFSLKKSLFGKKTDFEHITYKAKIVGVLAENAFSSLSFGSEKLVHSMGRFFFHQEDLFGPNNYGLMVRVIVDAPKNVPQVRKYIRAKGMETSSMDDIFGNLKKVFWAIEGILTLFSIIAFVIAIFSIVNTLLMSVYERKSEIGVLKALGATQNNIRALFALEAAAIGLCGGILGVLISLSVGTIGNYIAVQLYPIWQGHSLFYLDTSFILLLVLFSTVVGFIGGLYPAYQAARLEPIAALRYE